MTVRTRFAPSPTGFLHVGSLRTTVFSWLLAKKHGGQFILRIEDTDQERLVPGAIKALLDDLAWVGVTIDEGPSLADLTAVKEVWPGATGIGGPKAPYIQSQRLGRYKQVAEELIRIGAAYRCDCTSEMLEKERAEQMARREAPGYSGYCRTREVSPDSKHVVRIKMPEGSLSFEDGIRGNITWNSLSLKDPVLLKSDGFPTYHLAVVCDDHDMEITHALRGEEWIATTPIHITLYRALGWQAPVIGHLPNVLGEDGKKLSKRHGATFVSAFKEMGYLPGALLNFVALIGWSPGEGEEQEIFSKEDLIKRFSLEHVNTAGGVFSYSKLNWMNGMYIRAMSPEEFANRVKPFLEQRYPVQHDKLLAISPHIQQRLTVLTEATDMVEFLFVDDIKRDIEAMIKKDVTKEIALRAIDKARIILGEIPEFTHSAMEAPLRALATELGIKAGSLFMVLRIAAMGRPVTPPLFESLQVLGREKTLSRLIETERLLQ